MKDLTTPMTQYCTHYRRSISRHTAMRCQRGRYVSRYCNRSSRSAAQTQEIKSRSPAWSLVNIFGPNCFRISDNGKKGLDIHASNINPETMLIEVNRLRFKEQNIARRQFRLRNLERWLDLQTLLGQFAKESKSSFLVCFLFHLLCFLLTNLRSKCFYVF